MLDIYVNIHNILLCLCFYLTSTVFTCLEIITVHGQTWSLYTLPVLVSSLMVDLGINLRKQ